MVAQTNQKKQSKIHITLAHKRDVSAAISWCDLVGCHINAVAQLHDEKAYELWRRLAPFAG